jgi:CrcB protein
MSQMLLVGAGGFFGAICRFLLSQKWNRPLPHFPYGTLMVNLVGAFLLGMLVGSALSKEWLLLFGTGFLGAFTTFSTFSWESLQLIQHKEWWKLFWYLTLTYTLGILFALLGFLAGENLG